MMSKLFVSMAAALALTACERGGAAPGPVGDAGPEPAETSVQGTGPAPGDQLLPMAMMIERFQARLARSPDGFGPDAALSVEELMGRFVDAVGEADADALRRLRLDDAEFGHLYFPESRFSRPPYELPPETAWLLIEQNGLKGERRLLRELGGQSLGISGHRCEEEPRIEGANRLWEECRLLRRDSTGRLVEERLFGSVVERGGRFKFVSMANRL